MKKYNVITIKKSSASYNAQLVTSDQEALISLFVNSNTRVIDLDTTTYTNQHESLTLNTETLIYTSDNIDTLERAMRDIGFRKCDKCGKWFAPQDLSTHTHYMGNDTRYCNACFEQEYKNLYVIRSYHSDYNGWGNDARDNTVRYFKQDNETMDENNFKGYGFEIEIDNNNNSRMRVRKDNRYYARVTDDFYNLNGKSRKTHFKFEMDGSLNYGYEMISQVFSRKYLEQLDFNIIADFMKKAGHDDNVKSAGIHLHISKTIFGDNPKEQAINFLKLAYFMTIYKEDFIKLSKRDENSMNYCKFYTYDEIKDYHETIKRLDLSRNATDYLNSNHNRCLINSKATFEIRIFRSVADATWMKNCFLLMAGISENLKNVPFNKIYCLSKMFKNVDEKVINYFRKQGLFMRTYASEKKGEQL